MTSQEFDNMLDEIVLKPAYWRFDDYQQTKQELKQLFLDVAVDYTLRAELRKTLLEGKE